MRARRLRSLGVHDLDLVADHCACCAELLIGDRVWASGAVDRFGLCGVVAMDAERPQGWLLLSPALNLPAGHPLGTSAARSSDAAQLLAVHVASDARGVGIGGQLVQHAAARLVPMVSAIDAAGSHVGASCLTPPVGWLEHEGFTPLAAVTVPRVDATTAMRLDLTRSVRWRPMLGRALDAVTSWVKPAGAWPEPSGTRVADRQP